MWYNFRQNIIIIDCEMSGLDPDKNQLLEIAALNCDPKNLAVISSFHSLVGPENGDIYDVLYKANPRALSKNNLHKKASILSNAPSPKKAVSDLMNWLPKEYTLVGYNIMLDLLFLKAELEKTSQRRRLSYKIIDIAALIELYRAAKPGIINDWSLQGSCSGLGIQCPTCAHDASSDCEATRLLFQKLLQLFEINQ